jgi:prephenate dehydrogenase
MREPAGTTREAAARVGRVLIVGTGQIGTALGMALRDAPGVDAVDLCDLHPEVAKASLARGAGDRVVELEDPVDADAVILAMPVPEIVRWVDERSPGVSPGTLVLDTGSVKRPVVESMRRAVPEAVHAVGGHPIAGTERPGPDGAAPDLLKGAAFVLSPARRDPDGLHRARAVALAAGAIPVEVEARVHDAVLARTSHAPHLVAAAVARSVGGADRRLAGPGLAGITRLAASDPAMVSALLNANADQVRAALAELRRELDRAEASLAEGRDAVERFLARARSDREAAVG